MEEEHSIPAGRGAFTDVPTTAEKRDITEAPEKVGATETVQRARERTELNTELWMRLIERAARSRWLVIGVAVLGTAAAAASRLVLGRLVGDTLPPYITLYPVVIVSAILGGAWAGLFATGLAAATVTAMFLWPLDHAEITGLVLFVGINVATSFIGGALRTAWSRVRATANELSETMRLLDMACVLALDLNGRITRWNSGCQWRFGFSRSEALGRRYFELLQTRSHETWEKIRAILLAKGCWVGEMVHTTANGREVVCQSEWSLWRNSDGQPVAFLVAGTDVTQRKAVEQRLRLQSAAMDAAADSIMITDRDGTIQWVNTAFSRLTGYSLAEVIGRNPRLLKSGKTDPAVYPQLWQTILAGKVWHGQVINKRKDGQLYTEEMTIAPVCNAEGAIANFVASKTDVTVRLAAGEALREQARLATLRADATQALQQPGATQDLLQRIAGLLVERLDAAFARVWTLDGTGQTLELRASAGLYTHLNGEHGRIPVGGQLKIGRIAQERQPHVTNQVLGDPLVPHQDWARREGLEAFAGWPLLLEGNLLGVVALFARHPLSEAAVETFGLVAGTVAQFLGRKQTEEALRHALDELAGANTEMESKIEELRSAKANLAALNRGLENIVQDRTAKLRKSLDELEHYSYSITHDMRAPLRAMRSYASLLLRGSGANLTSNEREWLRNIAVSADRMDRLILDALDYSKTMREELPISAVDADALLRDILRSYPAFHPVMAKIEVQGTLPTVIGNAAGLTQCFSNILNNAVKFVPPGQMPHVRIRVEPEGARVRLWFEDNGIGIAKEHHERIFEMFHRLSEDYEGTGIGLALVKKVAEKMNGRVGVESEPGHGSRFWLDLEAAPVARQEAA
ncbi:MAG: PAS domain S-box protein [Verrucomicrobia bacterium]|nr:PAS domain S-box protein [Verrucomicrobiota bacterium]